MSADEQIQLARIGQKVDDLKDTLDTFIKDTKTMRADCFAWRTLVDADRNRMKGAIAVGSIGGGVIGALCSWVGRFIHIPI